MICPKCGKESNARFCTFCGAPMAQTEGASPASQGPAYGGTPQNGPVYGGTPQSGPVYGGTPQNGPAGNTKAPKKGGRRDGEYA